MTSTASLELFHACPGSPTTTLSLELLQAWGRP